MTETKQIHPVARFKNDLATLKDRGELDMLPQTVSYDAFRNAAVVAVTDNPQILSCSQQSVFKAIRTLAAAGLVPDGREAAIVPFKGAAQAMPMVAGLIKVARNSGKITSLWADVVYDGEDFTVWVEEGERKFKHDYDPLTRKGDIRGAYAVAKLSDGSVDMEPMSLDEIEKRRKASANQKGDKPTGIWQQWYGEMAKKTVIRALCKRLPMSNEDMERLMKEQEAAPMRDVTPEPPKETLAQRIMAQTPTHPSAEGAQAAAQNLAGPSTERDDADYIEGVKDRHSGVEEAETLLAEFDEDAVDPMTDEYDEGFKAHEAGKGEDACPHHAGTFEWNNWLGGYRFRAAHQDTEEAQRETEE